MPERFEIYIVYKRRYINMLPFLSFPDLPCTNPNITRRGFGPTAVEESGFHPRFLAHDVSKTDIAILSPNSA